MRKGRAVAWALAGGGAAAAAAALRHWGTGGGSDPVILEAAVTIQRPCEDVEEALDARLVPRRLSGDVLRRLRIGEQRDQIRGSDGVGRREERRAGRGVRLGRCVGG